VLSGYGTRLPDLVPLVPQIHEKLESIPSGEVIWIGKRELDGALFHSSSLNLLSFGSF